jgi:hypothetical protein
MAKLSVLQYLFIVDPTTGWTSGYDFEKTLREALSLQNLRGEVVNADGNSGLRVVHISSIDEMAKLNSVNQPKKGK